MKFNEKLIELRKKAGFSQEELGNKLNVSRQTVSKWELGVTTPEMDKLIALSEIFSISLDEFVKEKIDSNTRNNRPMIIIITIVSLIIVLILFLVIQNNLIKKNDNYEKLTISKVREIARKGEEISWSDFEKYKGKEIGSGLRIIYYEIDGIYDLMIGGTSEYERPMYVRLLLDDDKDKYVDITSGNIDDFIQKTKNINTSDVPATNNGDEEK